MIKSMTGFGRGTLNINNREYTVEIKTINHRYREISVRLPRYLVALEDPLRQLVAKNISRGKTEVFVSINNLGSNQKTIQIDTELAGVYINEMRRLATEYNLPDDITATSIMKLPDILVTSNNLDEEMYWEEMESCTKLALEKLNTARETEGNHLKQDILQRLEVIEKDVEEMSERSANLLEEYRNKLQERVAELKVDTFVDENRIAAEVVLFADKSSICEEVTRLRSHIKTLREVLNCDGAVGKKIDFLMQEMNREINTIGSKANCIDITNYVIAAKNELENIREQIQNIE